MCRQFELCLLCCLPCEQLDLLGDWFQVGRVAIDIASASSATGYGKETSKNGADDEHINF